MKNKKISKILIAGANSFCGLALSKYFIKKKIHVIGTFHKKKPKIKSKYFEAKKIDLTKKIFLKENIETIVHVASHHKIKDYLVNPHKKYQENILMTKNLIKIIDNNEIQNLIFFSTIDINNYKFPLKKKFYIKSKKKSEELYNASFLKKKIKKILFLRLPAILGKNCNDHFLKNTLEKLKKNKTVNIWNQNELYDNFIHVEDLNNLIFFFITNKIKSKKNIVECKVNYPMSVEKTIIMLRNKLGSNSKISINKFNQKKSFKFFKNPIKNIYKFDKAYNSLINFLKDCKA